MSISFVDYHLRIVDIGSSNVQQWYETFSVTSPSSQPIFPFLCAGNSSDSTINVLNGKRTKPKSYSYDLSSASQGLASYLASTFGVLPFDPITARRHMEKSLTPLIVANKQRFPELDMCEFWRDWRGKEITYQTRKMPVI